jgi:hypothetical protein
MIKRNRNIFYSSQEKYRLNTLSELFFREYIDIELSNCFTKIWKNKEDYAKKIFELFEIESGMSKTFKVKKSHFDDFVPSINNDR